MAQLQAVKKSYPVWTDRKIHTEAWTGDVTIQASKLIGIINLVSAELRMSVRAELSPCGGRMLMNGSPVGEHNFLYEGELWADVFDVKDLILSGSNVFTYTVTKIPMVGWGDVYVTVNLVVEGEIIVGPTWPTWWPYAALGIGMAAVGGVIYYTKK